MEALDIELALRIYRQLGDAAMVLGLEKVLQVRKNDGTLPLKRLSNVHGFDQCSSITVLNIGCFGTD